MGTLICDYLREDNLDMCIIFDNINAGNFVFFTYWVFQLI